MPDENQASPVRRLFPILGLAVVLSLAGSLAAARMLAPQIARPKACPAVVDESDFDMLLACGKMRYSQYREELIIRHFFRDRRGGVFVDIGSAFYDRNSTTYYLEHHLGWSGVAVDALPDFGPDYEKYRPSTRFFSYLVTDHAGTVEPFYKLKKLSLMSTKAKDWAETYGHDDYETLQRPTITMNALMEKANLTRFDFLSMDIETGEPAALAGFDIDRYHPALVCIEVTDGVRDRVAAYFEAHAYERIVAYAVYDQLNWYFRPRTPARPGP